MEISTEHRDGEITVFVNSETPEIQLTTRREEAKATVNENSLPIVVVAENISSVKDAAKYVDTFDDVIASLPQIMEAATAAQRAEKAEEGAKEAKDLSVESAAVASASASSATLSAQKASESETKALASEQSALNSANSASASKTSAQNSALAAAESASSAKQDLASIKADAEMVAEYAPKAIQAAESAENAKASAISAANRAENASQSVGVALEGKQDKLTAGEGIKIEGNVISTEASLPDNVYTEDNLKGGKDIEIVKKSGGIDENTLACWHFEGTINDEVNGTPANANSATLVTDYTKFGTGSVNGNVTHTAITKDANAPISFDFWALVPVPGISSYAQFILDTSDPAYAKKWIYVMGIAGSKLTVALMGGATVTTDFTVPKGEWVHYYGHYIPDTQTTEFFANGKKIFSQQNANYPGITKFDLSKSGVCRFDEVRISKAIRWTEDFTPPDAPYEAGSAGSVINFTGQSGKNIGEVYYSQSSLASDNAGALPLFTGETIASADTIYPDFYNWVESHTELQTTAEEYETALSTCGECAKYVVSNGSLRLPKLANYIKMANASEGITQGEAGLPNITGYASPRKDGYDGGGLADGAFWLTSDTASAGHGASEKGSGVRINFDASRSSEVYGKSDTVTPAHTTLYPWVFAYNASVPASTAQAAEFQEGLSGKADANLGNIPTNYDYVVERYEDEQGNWYEVWKSGRLRQGGIKEGSGSVTFLKPFINANYTITTSMMAVEAHYYSVGVHINPTPSTTGFTASMWNNAAAGSDFGSWYWQAEGKGA